MKNTLFLLCAVAICLLGCKSSQKVAQNEVISSKDPPSEAFLLAQQQLEAYNKRDLEAFLFPFSDSVKVYKQHTLSYEGKDNMREGYAGWFGSLDSLHCTVLQRISEGNTVIDHERIYYKRKNGESSTYHTIAIYTIKNGKIQEVIFPKISWQ